MDSSSNSKFRLTIRVKQIPDCPVYPHIYLSGNINNWNPSDSSYLLARKGEEYEITFHDVPRGIYEFKLTRGSWEKVECKPDGEDIPNRKINLTADTSLDWTIAAWKDQVPTVRVHHTKSTNVTVVATDFYIPELHRKRRIWAYLPPNYENSAKRYPVLYMQDGQNLFDEATAAYGEWGVDELLDSFYRQGVPDIIVIGIDNGGKHRINEYNPYDNKKYGSGEGKKYAKFLAETLKPYIDKHYRTLPGPEHTGVAGSSMGGLISFYIWLRYPDIFGKAGIMSPSFWIAPEIKKQLQLTDANKKGRLFFIAGNAESKSMVSDMKAVYNKLIQQGMPADQMHLRVVPGAHHSEKYWHEEFPKVFLRLYDSSDRSTKKQTTPSDTMP